jgi:PadR family transcriptional regulator, regulatory protein AphA
MMRKASKTQYAILGMLSLGPKSGYDIRREIQGSLAHFWGESDGQLYPVLRALEAVGDIKSETQSVGKREKKIYEMTASGKQTLETWLYQAVDTHVVRNELLLKLFFGANVEKAVCIRHVEARKQHLLNLLDEYTLIEASMTDEERQSPHFPYWEMTIDCGKQSIAASLTWCDNALNKLNDINT